ncbi:MULTISPECIES: metal ABC transporter ATP-binding protein [unclassified Agrococcus]|uniref:metal ABC transporter ATP-binding protein n=1 Tax=unclassified Agrococcus TaxID=2615065 RepID=UPI00361E6F4D
MPTLVLDRIVAHRDGHPALVDVSLTLPAARVTALVGDNGSGKSTMLEVLAGVLAHDGAIDGLPERRALVVQRTDLAERLPMTARAAVAMGLWRERGPLRRLTRDDRARVDAALDVVGMRALASRQLAALSGGQRQRVLVAQGLVQDAPLTLLDEPTASADAASRDRIDAAMRALAERGSTVIVATHDRASLARADHAVLLERGRVVAEGVPEEVAAEQVRRAAAALALP